ncbi:DEAD/DEAH box helicase family protein [bacterium]|nr:DEAD/DEAH box helicase family protein [bacterium]
MKKDNPFTLTFGRQPNEYITRYENMNSIISTFEADNPISQSFLIEGIRGSGKTVLMTAIENELSQKSNWIIVSLNPTRELLEDLAMRLSNEYKKISSALKSGFNISVGGFGIGINGKNSPDSIIVIEDILESLKKKNKKILITIDEVMHNENMKRFASEFQLFIRKNYPIYLLMTGLYENIYAIQNDPALTFLLRTPKLKMEPLSILQISKQYKRIFGTDDNTSKKLALITKGYAFAFQALGLLYYEYCDELPINEILSKLDDMLDDFVYKKIWSALSENDKKIVSVFDESPIKTKTISEKTGIPSSSLSKYRERLINRGLLISSQHGYLSLALPRFSNIITTYQ